jgi:hypothetical protein
MHIVSLLASATEIVCALGVGELLVGRSHECDNPEWVKRLPACSAPAFDVSVSSGEIDTEVRRQPPIERSGACTAPARQVALQADLLISQSHCEVWWRELQAVHQGNVAFADGNLLFNRSGMTVSQRTERARWRRIEKHAQEDSQRVTMSRA